MRVIITAGGTGGHIIPALAIADKVMELDNGSEILYIGTHNRMEKDLVPNRGYRYEPIEIYGLSKRDFKTNFKNIGLIIKAKKRCLKLIEEFKPDVVVGVGGYVTFPVLRAAKKLGIKTFIHEQNSIPGKSNRVLAHSADKIGLSFADSIKYFDVKKCVITGNPCSEFALDAKATPKTKFGLSRSKKSILIVQGSLGSSVMNNKMLDYLMSIDKEDYDVLYITGKDHYDTFSQNKFSKNVKVVPYVDNLAALMKDMDLIISRAGASTISEITALAIPNILIPSPYVANNHQFYNALSIKEAGAGDMIEEADLTTELLKKKINKILTNNNYKEKMIKNLKKIAIPNSSTIIYDVLKDLTK
ncbi:MAG: undecaprenyldiphospho-muramoylpentapeptide beta-N-acetylglucosaminyltransferase [Bacilli bacterium]|nr:undecaprenyldiphospho-muramoylpentapeptide beta-N-acetylglucosaminyltransferase [Bacilli bacterium]